MSSRRPLPPTVPPGLTCATCGGRFLRAPATRTDAGWIHADACPAEPWHGTLGGYTNRKCRDACCQAARALDACRRRRAEQPRPDEIVDVDPMQAQPGNWVTVRGIARWVPSSVVG